MDFDLSNSGQNYYKGISKKNRKFFSLSLFLIKELKLSVIVLFLILSN